MIDAVLCELEGAVVDSAAQRRRALRRAFAGEKIALADALYDEHCAGIDVENAVAAALRVLPHDDDPVLPELLVLASRRHFTDEILRGVLRAPGITEFLAAARAAARLALVTRAARSEAELLVAAAGLDSVFEFMVCSDDAREPGIRATRHEMALARLGRRGAVHRDRVLAIEDRMAGARTALASGVRCVLVGVGAHDAAAGIATVPSLAGETPASLAALLDAAEEKVA
jgi:beta-phosphoglucomutase-like phosphatase (HAD superfamily)